MPDGELFYDQSVAGSRHRLVAVIDHHSQEIFLYLEGVDGRSGREPVDSIEQGVRDALCETSDRPSAAALLTETAFHLNSILEAMPRPTKKEAEKRKAVSATVAPSTNTVISQWMTRKKCNAGRALDHLVDELKRLQSENRKLKRDASKK